MKENKYDEAQFFEKYSAMTRSQDGLEGAGEWHALKEMLPGFNGKRVLDLGCGFGWHCQWAAAGGASQVLGIDISEKMIARARQLNAYADRVSYRVAALEDYEYPAAAYDIVLSSLAFHYIPSFGEICSRIAATLKDGGVFIFSVEHPVFTAYGSQDWFYGEENTRMHWPVDRYFSDGRRDAVFLGENVVKYHRSLTSYVSALLDNGFAIRDLVEPRPDPTMLDTVPDMADELRRPMMLIISATKKPYEP